jgi:hypothetical protein
MLRRWFPVRWLGFHCLASSPLALALVAPGADEWGVSLAGRSWTIDFRDSAGQPGANIERSIHVLEEELADWAVQRFDLEYVPSGNCTVILHGDTARGDIW